MTAAPASRPPRPTVLEIDLDAAAANVRAVRRARGPGRKIFAVVKADGYGHGAAELGAVFAAHGADALAVADLGEGIRLRQRGITAPILVYPNSLPDAAPEAIAHGLIPTLVDLDSARAYAEAAAGPCDVFVKIDVGLERLGVPAEQAVKTVAAMLELPRLRLAGLCAHPQRPTAPTLPTPSGSSAGSPRWSTSWRRVASGCPSGCSPPRPSCCDSPRRTSTPSTPDGCSTASSSPARRRRSRFGRRSEPSSRASSPSRI